MVNIFCDNIDAEILQVAKSISQHQKDTVRIITSTKTLEVRYEKESEKTQEKTFKVQEQETEP